MRKIFAQRRSTNEFYRKLLQRTFLKDSCCWEVGNLFLLLDQKIPFAQQMSFKPKPRTLKVPNFFPAQKRWPVKISKIKWIWPNISEISFPGKSFSDRIFIWFWGDPNNGNFTNQMVVKIYLISEAHQGGDHRRSLWCCRMAGWRRGPFSGWFPLGVAKKLAETDGSEWRFGSDDDSFEKRAVDFFPKKLLLIFLWVRMNVHFWVDILNCQKLNGPTNPVNFMHNKGWRSFAERKVNYEWVP